MRQEGRKEGAPIFESMSKQGVKEGPFSPFEFSGWGKQNYYKINVPRAQLQTGGTILIFFIKGGGLSKVFATEYSTCTLNLYGTILIFKEGRTSARQNTNRTLTPRQETNN